MQRYFVSFKDNDIFTLTEEDSHHVINVMRMKVNDEVEIVYDNKLFLGSIKSLETPVEVSLLKEINTLSNTIPKVIIAQALVKEQKMDYILQKSCELGVSEIIPIKTIRSVVKVDSDDSKKVSRWSKILKEASEQSKRVDIPKIRNVIDLKELVKIDADHKFICSVKESSKTIKSVLSNVNISDTIIFVIGPEGGFDTKEEDYLIDNGFSSITFGNNVLRTETSSLYILSVINYEFMR